MADKRDDWQDDTDNTNEGRLARMWRAAKQRLTPGATYPPSATGGGAMSQDRNLDDGEDQP